MEFALHLPAVTRGKRPEMIIAGLMVCPNGRTVVCARCLAVAKGYPRRSRWGLRRGLKRPSWIMCDNLVSLQKSDLTYFVGSSARLQMAELDRALKMALELD